MKKNINIFGYNLYLELTKRIKSKVSENFDLSKINEPYKLNFGPGPNWEKPDDSWLTVDIDPALGNIIVDFQSFEALPLKDDTVSCVYGSHVFEHVSILKSPIIFKEIYRVLNKGGVFRLIIPDAEKSVREYVKGNKDFLLFRRQKERVKKYQNMDYTLFECMREDFISPSWQRGLLGKNALAHQNAWDFETIKSHLVRAGFSDEKVFKMGFQKSNNDSFNFEGTYKSEANEDYRSLYVEAIKE